MTLSVFVFSVLKTVVIHIMTIGIARSINNLSILFLLAKVKEIYELAAVTSNNEGDQN